MPHVAVQLRTKSAAAKILTLCLSPAPQPSSSTRLGSTQGHTADKCARRIQGASKVHVIPTGLLVSGKWLKDSFAPTSSLQHSRYPRLSRFGRLCDTYTVQSPDAPKIGMILLPECRQIQHVASVKINAEGFAKMRETAALSHVFVRVPGSARNILLWSVRHDLQVPYVTAMRNLVFLHISDRARSQSWPWSLTDVIDGFCAYVAALSVFSLIHAVSTGGNSTKCFLPII